MALTTRTKAARVAAKCAHLFRGRGGISLLISTLSLVIALLSFWQSKVTTDMAVRSERASIEKEKREKMLFLTGRPDTDGQTLELRAPDPAVIFLSMKVKLEYSKNVSEFDLPPAGDTLTMDYIHPYLSRRVKVIRESKKYQNMLSSMLPGGTGELIGAIPVLILTNYIINGETLEDLSFYSLGFSATWRKETPSETVKFTGLAFCARVPIKDKAEWLAPDFVFVGTDYVGTIEGVKAVGLVNCGP